MWQFLMGFGAGVYVGTSYDCKPTVSFITNFIKNNVPKEALPKKRMTKNNLLINKLNYFLDRDGILYSPSSTIYLAIILGLTVLFKTS